MKNILLVLSLFVLMASCNSDTGGQSFETDSIAEPNQVGKGGSTTRFTIVGSFLYVVEDSYLKTFDLTDPASPELKDNLQISDELETIFPYEFEGDKVLLLGAKSGMHVYQIGSDGVPDNSSNIVLGHQTSCDPVIAHNGYAYVTLRSSNTWGCEQGFNQLHVNNISNLNDINKEYSINMEGPKGLSFSADKTSLLVCDKSSLKVFSLTDPSRPVLENTVNTIQCNDILEYKGNYIATGDNLLKIYSYDEATYELTFEINLLTAQ